MDEDERKPSPIMTWLFPNMFPQQVKPEPPKIDSLGALSKEKRDMVYALADYSVCIEPYVRSIHDQYGI